jgi:hypothetical protein
VGGRTQRSRGSRSEEAASAARPSSGRRSHGRRRPRPKGPAAVHGEERVVRGVGGAGAGRLRPAGVTQGLGDGLGTLILVPTTSVLVLMSGLSARMSFTVVLYLMAMPDSVSPSLTVYFL